jgi:hypothetical protein
MLEELKKICDNYLIKVYNGINKNDDNDDDWWNDTFLFESTNNYIEGEYDIMNCDIDVKYINYYVKENVFDIINYINTFYEDNYGTDCILDWKKLDDEYLIRHFVYVYGHENISSIKKMLV